MRLIAPHREIQMKMVAVLGIGVGTQHRRERPAGTSMQPPQERLERQHPRAVHHQLALAEEGDGDVARQQVDDREDKSRDQQRVDENVTVLKRAS